MVNSLFIAEFLKTNALFFSFFISGLLVAMLVISIEDLDGVVCIPAVLISIRVISIIYESLRYEIVRFIIIISFNARLDLDG